MNPSVYLDACLVTEHTPDFVRLFDKAGNPRDPEHNRMVARLLHAMLGIVSEAGELADALKKHIIYGAELDRLNLLEETGDLTWYESLALSALRSGWEEIWEKNIAKLKARFGDRFTQAAALTRNLDAERRALATGGQSDGSYVP